MDETLPDCLPHSSGITEAHAQGGVVKPQGGPLTTSHDQYAIFPKEYGKCAAVKKPPCGRDRERAPVAGIVPAS